MLTKPIIPELLADAIAAHCAGAAATPPGENLLLNLKTRSDLGNNPERTRQYQDMLQLDIADELQYLLAALDCDNRSDLGRAAHTLKGLCGHLAQPEPAELATWLQHNAASARLEELRPVLEQLQTTCQRRPTKEPLEDNS